jgi:hypothetical protein
MVTFHKTWQSKTKIAGFLAGLEAGQRENLPTIPQQPKTHRDCNFIGDPKNE